jgi:hypothetical protein
MERAERLFHYRTVNRGQVVLRVAEILSLTSLNLTPSILPKIEVPDSPLHMERGMKTLPFAE